MALAPPPGTTVLSRCLRIRTGASRETREISPKTNSSATISPRTVTVIPGKRRTISFRRSCWAWALKLRLCGSQYCIFSCHCLAAAQERSEHGIDGFASVLQLHAHGNYCNGIQPREQLRQVDRVFLSGYRAARSANLAQFEQLANVRQRIGVVIAKHCLGHSIDSGGAKLGKKVLRTGDSAEGHRSRRNSLGRNSATHPPYSGLRPGGNTGRIGASGKHDSVGASERRDRLAQPARGQKPVAGVLGSEQHYIEISRQLPVLET